MSLVKLHASSFPLLQKLMYFIFKYIILEKLKFKGKNIIKTIMQTKNKRDKQIQDKKEIMRGYNLVMSRIYNFLTLVVLNILITKSHQTLLNEAKTKKFQTILDVGCGTGTQLLMLTKNYQYQEEIYGTDISKEMLKIAKKRKNKNPNKITLILADAENLPFKSETFDLITNAGVLRFLPEPEKMITDVFRVLKNKGSFILRDFAGPKKGFRTIEIQHFPLPFQKRYTVWRLRSDEQIGVLLEKSGFSNIKIFRKGKIPHIPIAMGGIYRTNMFAKSNKNL